MLFPIEAGEQEESEESLFSMQEESSGLSPESPADSASPAKFKSDEHLAFNLREMDGDAPPPPPPAGPSPRSPADFQKSPAGFEASPQAANEMTINDLNEAEPKPSEQHHPIANRVVKSPVPKQKVRSPKQTLAKFVDKAKAKSPIPLHKKAPKVARMDNWMNSIGGLVAATNVFVISIQFFLVVSKG